MADKNFSTRLKDALVAAKIEPLSPTRIAKDFNQRHYGKDVTVQAVRKWLEGSALPEPEKMITLGKWLGVSPAWLLFAENSLGAKEGEATYGAQPQLIADFNRLTLHQQEMILEIIALMLKASVKPL